MSHLKPATNYNLNGVTPSPVPLWQYTGSGYVPVSISLQSSTASAQYDIEAKDPLNCVMFEQYILGWSYKKEIGADSPPLLKRVLPAFCPVRPYMYASCIAGAEGIANTGKATNSAASAAWKLMRYTVQFETPPYPVKPDNAVTSELQRFVGITDITPSTETFKYRPGAFKWPSNAPGVANTSFNDGVSFNVCKQQYTITWVNLPDDGLWTKGGFWKGGSSPNIEDGIGKLNTTTFMGKPPGTMLLESWKPIMRAMPNINLADAWAKNRLDYRPGWDAQFNFCYFDPPHSATLVGTSQVGGHNLTPHPTNGIWYRPYLVGQVANTQYRYEDYDMNLLFILNNTDAV